VALDAYRKKTNNEDACISEIPGWHKDCFYDLVDDKFRSGKDVFGQYTDIVKTIINEILKQSCIRQNTELWSRLMDQKHQMGVEIGDVLDRKTMKNLHTIVGRTKSGRFKVYWFGQPELHISNWRGCNYKFVTAKGQPFRGFEKYQDAVAFEKELREDEERYEKEKRIASSYSGSSMADERTDLCSTCGAIKPCKEHVNF